MTSPSSSPVEELLQRSHVLGSNPRYTNYAGGNTSSKGRLVDPITREEVDAIWIKGSGADLATLTEDGLTVLRLDRLRTMNQVYRGHEDEDDMVPLFGLCGIGPVGATPSIDTAMHGLVEAAHVDHLHSDAPLALATAADGRRLTLEAFGKRVLWVDWMRPGWQLGLEIAELHAHHPQAIGCILGGHGFTAWGSTSAQCMAHALEIIHGAEEFIRCHGRPEPLGGIREGCAPLPADERRARAAAMMPVIRGLASTGTRVVGHYTDSDEVLEFVGSEKLERLAALGTSCPDHFTRTKIRPLVLDLPPSAPFEEVVQRLEVLHQEYRLEYTKYYARRATPDSPPMRHPDPAIVLVPGVGMFSFGLDKHTAQIVGEFFLSDINAMRGAEALSTYAPIPESEQFRIEYWPLERSKLERTPKRKPLGGRVALVLGGGSQTGRCIAEQLVREGACVVLADEDSIALEKAAAEIAVAEQVSAVVVKASVPQAISEVLDRVVLEFGGIDILVRASEKAAADEAAVAHWHDNVTRATAAVMASQGLGGDVVCLFRSDSRATRSDDTGSSSVSAPQHVALLARQLRAQGVRVNGIAYADVAPEHVADAVLALTTGGLAHSTGAFLPVGDISFDALHPDTAAGSGVPAESTR